MADSFLGIFDSVGDTIDGLFEGAKDIIGVGNTPDTTSSGGDFFGKKVAGAIFGGAGKSSSSNRSQSISLDEGQVGTRRGIGASTQSKIAPYADPKTIESEWTNRLFKFANLNKLVNNTAGKLDG